MRSQTEPTDVDVESFLHNLRATKPPYECPADRCGRVYKSFAGIQVHLETFDHSTAVTPKSVRKKGKNRRGQQQQQEEEEESPPAAGTLARATRESRVTYIDSTKTLEYETDGCVLSFHIGDRLPFSTWSDGDVAGESQLPQCVSQRDECDAAVTQSGAPHEKRVKLPEAHFSVVSDYEIADAPPLPNNYIRFIEKSAEDLDEEIEYDMDEEDVAWLEIMNEQRRLRGLSAVKDVDLELLMDRLEKESFFQAQTTMGTNVLPTDEEAVCCICMDGECENSNVILFCDMCNLAVHQECYGVPYIPEGQWWCRRCLQSPSRAVDCVLCPNRGGAFKQTDDGRWAHVVCALWVPEVCFANTVFLEPIDSIDRIPAARWKLSCYICKQRNAGACIQCHKANCYTAFHVTCAQQAGMHIKIDAVRESAASTAPYSIRKAAFCDVHTPADSHSRPSVDESAGTGDSARKAQMKAESRQKMRKARKLLAERRTAVPVVSVPTIPPERIQHLASLIDYSRKNHFIQRLLAFWTLKRHSRNGVPLLRRLQTSNKQAPPRRFSDQAAGAVGAGAPPEPAAAVSPTPLDPVCHREQLKTWQRLRQDLEKVRLLCELVRKREKTKRELIKCMRAETRLRLCPLSGLFANLLDQLTAKDQTEIFAEPVDTEEVTDYLTVIDKPMDLSTMRHKVNTYQYWSLDDFSADFELMIRNCLTYNDKDTVFYKAGLRMRQAGGAIIRKARAELAQMRLPSALAKTESKSDEEIIKQANSCVERCQSGSWPAEEQLNQLQQLQQLVKTIRNAGTRTKWVRIIKSELSKAQSHEALSASHGPRGKKKLRPTPSTPSLREASEEGSSSSNSSSSSSSTSASSSSDDDDHDEETEKVNPGSKQKITSHSSSSPARNANTARDDAELVSKPLDNSAVVAADTVVRVFSAQKQCSAPSNSVVSSSGVNRRTAVLFNKKNSPSPQKRSVERRNRSASNSSGFFPAFGGSLLDGVSWPDTKSSQSATVAMDTSSGLATDEQPLRAAKSSSFTEYRQTADGDADGSDDDTDTKRKSGGDGFSAALSSLPPVPGITSDCSEDGEDADGDDDEDGAGEEQDEEEMMETVAGVETECGRIALEPLDLIWAKCRGYPWYPALIINPKMPRTGYFHNGVPIPVPPQEVLDLAEGSTRPQYLILFFDAKRTWQWLPREKLEPLGVDPTLDQAKMVSAARASDRRAVRLAYEKAVLHQCRVSGKTAAALALQLDKTG